MADDFGWGKFNKGAQPQDTKGGSFEELYPDYADPLPPSGKKEEALSEQPAVVQQPVVPRAIPADRSWGDTLKGAFENAPQSAFGVLDDTARAIVHPIDSAKALGSTARGLYRKAEDYLNPNPSVREPADDPERVKDLASADALVGDYKDKYGSMPGFKKRLAEDPFNIGMDVGTVVAPLASATSKVPIAGKIARGAQLVADPLEATTAASRKLMTPLADTMNAGQRAWMALHSQKGVEPYRVLQEAAKIKGPEGDRVRGVVKQYMSGDGKPEDIADAATSAFEEIKQNASNNYKAQFSDVMKFARPLPFDRVTKAAKEMADYANIGHPTAHDAMLADQALQMVKDRFNDPKLPKDMEGFDRMKIDIRNRAGDIQDARLKKLVEEMANSAKQTIVDSDPKYAQMMEDWQEWIKHANDLKKTLGTGSHTLAESTLIKKLQSSMKDDRKGELMAKLAETQAGKDLPYMIAGQSLRDKLPHYAFGNIANMAPAMIGYGAHMFASPGTAMMKATAAVPGLLSASPRLSGNMTLGTGAVRRGLSKATEAVAKKTVDNPLVNNPLTRQSIYQTGRSMEEKDDGRPLRAHGGRVRAVPHEDIADRLVAQAERAKKLMGKTTEALLNTPDDMVAKALEVANRGI